ncbi:hypothetical protein Tco_0480649 [Tanacetum coccineum]
MASLDYRLNPLFTIKECSSCGSLYNKGYCCTPDSSQQPLRDCPKCGNPVEGPNCQGCALWRKKLKEVWFTICHENGIYQDLLNTYESSDDDTNVVNAPREPFVVKQDPGVNSSQSPPLIDHHCCYECGDSLNDIFCQRCTCKSCGKGAHYGYNCPPQIPIISNPEPCYNQNLNEILQNLQSLQQQCLLGTCQQCGCNEYDGVCFYCTVGNGTPINFSTPYSSNDSPSFANHPPQPQYVPYSCELCGNDAHHGYDCPPQVPFVYNQDPCSNQNFDYFPQTSPSFPQQYPCCEDCGGPHETFQCQPMNYYEPNPCYDSNYSGFDQTQPPQYTVNHPIFNAQNELLNSQNKIMEQMTSICDMVGQYMQKKEEDRRIAEDQAAKDRYWKIPICYDDDEDYTIAITPVDQIDDEVLENTNSIPPGIEYLCFNAESDLLESLLHRDTSINDSQKIDSPLDEFTGELTLPHSIPPGIDDVNLDPEGDILFLESLLYDNSSPRPPEEFNSENSIESFPPSHIPVEDSDSLMEEIDIFLDGDDSIPPGIESDDFDSEDDDNSK